MSPPDRIHPEAEWGYAPELTSDALRFADRHGYRVERLHFDDPEHLSPWVADLYRQRVVNECGAPDRLLVEPFFLVDPWCTYRTGSVPFWTVFNAKSSAQAVESYLDAVEPFEEIRAVLFSNGVRAPNTATADHWQAILNRSRGARGFLGVKLQDYPEDFAVYFRYHDALERLPSAPRAPRTLSWAEIQAHAALNNHLHPVQLDCLND